MLKGYNLNSGWKSQDYDPISFSGKDINNNTNTNFNANTNNKELARVEESLEEDIPNWSSKNSSTKINTLNKNSQFEINKDKLSPQNDSASSSSLYVKDKCIVNSLIK